MSVGVVVDGRWIGMAIALAVCISVSVSMSIPIAIPIAVSMPIAISSSMPISSPVSMPISVSMPMPMLLGDRKAGTHSWRGSAFGFGDKRSVATLYCVVGVSWRDRAKWRG